MVIQIINNLINFVIFRENEALFEQIVVIFDQIVVINRPMCKVIFPIENE
jgi:hypothetical protein